MTENEAHLVKSELDAGLKVFLHCGSGQYKELYSVEDTCATLADKHTIDLKYVNVNHVFVGRSFYEWNYT